MPKELKTGITVLLIIALGIWGYNFLKDQSVFNTGTRNFFVEYNNINGLTKESIVTINGLQVGKVNSIKFNKDTSKRGHLIVNFVMSDNFKFSKESVVKIYSSNPLAGSNLAITPRYEGQMAESGDWLKGEIEVSLFNSIGEKLDPIQTRLNNILINADSLAIGLNQVFDKQAKESLQKTIAGFQGTVDNFNRTLNSANQLMEDNKAKIEVTLDNAKKFTENISKISEDLAKVDLGQTIKKLENAIINVNSLMSGIQNEKGTLGKLIIDEKLYENLTNAAKEMEELLREMKLNPKRFVHFSLFGKKVKPYNQENN